MQYGYVVQCMAGPETRILDANENGRLDRDDWITYVEDGNTITRPLEEVELYDIQQRASAVAGASALDARYNDDEIGFSGDMEDQTYDEDYWQLVEIDGSLFWQVKDGVNPSDAINNLFDTDGGTYNFDCAAGSNLILYKSRLDTIGSEDFDREYGGLTIKGWTTFYMDPEGDEWLESECGALDYVVGDRDTPCNGSEVMIGEYAYFTNPDVPQGSDPSQGENVICVGSDEEGELLTYGYPLGVESGTDIGWAFLSTIHGWIDPALLAMQDIVKELSWNIIW